MSTLLVIQVHPYTTNSLSLNVGKNLLRSTN